MEYSDEKEFNSLEEFCEYYNLEIVDCDTIEESFTAEVGERVRKYNDKEYFKKLWKNLSGCIQHQTAAKKLNEREYKELQKNFEILKTSNDYRTYKKAYENVCKFFKLTPYETTIKTIKFIESEDKQKYATMEYHVGKKKVMVPNGVRLIHTTSADNIKELVPNFCSKRKGYYMWPTKRVYFTLGKEIDNGHVGIKDQKAKTHHYTPVNPIQTVYIDAELPSYKMSAVYVDTQFPIKVKVID